MSANITLLRHGETESSQPKRLHGRSDVALTSRGYEQMAASVGGQHWDVVISSPLQRCANFAKRYADKLGVKLEIVPALQEYDFGAWEGQLIDQLAAQYGQCYLDFFLDPQNHSAPAGEHYAAFQARVLGAWLRTKAEYANTPVLVITHGGPIRLILGYEKSLSHAECLGIDVPHASLHPIEDGNHNA